MSRSQEKESVLPTWSLRRRAGALFPPAWGRGDNTSRDALLGGDPATSSDTCTVNANPERPPLSSNGSPLIPIRRDQQEQESSPTSPRSNGSDTMVWIPILGMFLSFVIHDALQERIFRFQGFEFGWFMTMAEVIIMLMGGIVTDSIELNKICSSSESFATNFVIGLCVAGSHGLSNTALRFSTYPLKVAFKSCKLIPTMGIGFFVTGRHHSFSEYGAALVMCVGLTVLTLADYDGSHPDTTKPMLPPGHHLAAIGPAFLAISTALDSIVPNLQERLFQQSNARTVDMIFMTNLVMMAFSVVYCYASGELFEALAYCHGNPQVLGVLVIQAASAYVGLCSLLTVIKMHGGVVGVVLANGRKVVTIVLSFALFAKPCRILHVWGLGIVFFGVYLGVVAKWTARTAKAAQKEKHEEARQEGEDPSKPAEARS